MAYSNVSYAGDGTTTVFSVPFSYLQKAHVTVYVNGLVTAFTWASSTTVSISPAPAVGTQIQIKRATPISNPLVVYTDSATLQALDLNTATSQSLYALQENADGVVAGNSLVTPQMFGAKGDGVTDDTVAFNRALAVTHALYVPWGIYKIKDVVINTHTIVYGNNSIFQPAAGAVNCVFKLTGFRPSLVDCYMDGSGTNLAVNVGANASVIIQNASFPTIRNVQFENSGVAIMVGGDMNEVKKVTIRDVVLDTFDNIGLLVQPNVNTGTFDNIRAYSGTIPKPSEPGKSNAKAGCIGVKMVGTGSTVACGGHLLTNIDCEGMPNGFVFVDAQLTTLQNCIGDSLSNACYQLLGTCDRVKFDNCYAGAARIGFDIQNTCVNIWITNPTFAGLGTLYAWEASDWYTAGGVYCISVSNTANATMGGAWTAGPEVLTTSMFFVAPTATFSFENDTPEHFGGVTATDTIGSVQYLVYGGSSTSEFPGLVAHKAGWITGLLTGCNNDPGAGKTFTYMIRKNTFDTGVQVVVTGTGSTVFSGSAQGFAFVNPGDVIDIKVTPQAGAASAFHRAVLKVRYIG